MDEPAPTPRTKVDVEMPPVQPCLTDGQSLVSTQRWKELNAENERLKRELEEVRPAVDLKDMPAQVEALEKIKQALIRRFGGVLASQEIARLGQAYIECPITPHFMEVRRAWPSDVRVYVNRLEAELRAIHVMAQPDWAVHFPAASVAAGAALLEEVVALRKELVNFQVKCGQCICGSGTTDECCPQCIPGVPADIFQRYEAAVKLIEKVRRVGNSSAFVSVFACASNHHAGYRGESWKLEMDDFDRACGRPVNSEPPIATTTETGSSGRVGEGAP